MTAFVYCLAAFGAVVICIILILAAWAWCDSFTDWKSYTNSLRDDISQTNARIDRIEHYLKWATHKCPEYYPPGKEPQGKVVPIDEQERTKEHA